MPDAVIEAEKITVRFPAGRRLFRRRYLTAVDGVSLTISRGETLGLVGESGSGKSTTGRALLGIEPMQQGQVRLLGRSLDEYTPRQLRRARRAAQMVFQDPGGSLNPRRRVGDTITEPMRIHRIGAKADAQRRAIELLEMVGLDGTFLDRYPHTMSGGQQQRVAIARALAPEPSLMICDEAVSSLDVSIQAQVVTLLRDIQHRTGLAYLFIAHDLAVVRHIAHQVAVMHLGEIVEHAPSQVLYSQPLHPYTKALLSSVPKPVPSTKREPRLILRGDMPDASDPPSGCRFRSRCPWAEERCAAERPRLRMIGESQVACHFAEQIRDQHQRGQDGPELATDATDGHGLSGPATAPSWSSPHGRRNSASRPS